MIAMWAEADPQLSLLLRLSNGSFRPIATIKTTVFLLLLLLLLKYFVSAPY